jgi:hypothetical protein
VDKSFKATSKMEQKMVGVGSKPLMDIKYLHNGRTVTCMAKESLKLMGKMLMWNGNQISLFIMNEKI